LNFSPFDRGRLKRGMKKMWSTQACLRNNGAVAYATAIHITALIRVIPAEAGNQKGEIIDSRLE